MEVGEDGGERVEQQDKPGAVNKITEIKSTGDKAEHQKKSREESQSSHSTIHQTTSLAACALGGLPDRP